VKSEKLIPGAQDEKLRPKISAMKTTGPLLFIFSLFIACSPQQKLERLENKHPELFKPILKDSVSNTVEYVAHDSIINIPGANTVLHDTFRVDKPCPLHYQRVLKTGNETATLKIDSGQVTVICHEDSLRREIIVKDKIISNFKEHVQVGVAEHTIYKTRWYDYFCRTVVALSLLFLLLWIALHAAKLPLP